MRQFVARHRAMCSWLVLALALVPLSARAETVRFVPAAAHSAGAGGTFWTSDLSLFNPSTSRTLNVSLSLLPAGSDNRNPKTTSVSLATRGAVVLRDVVGQVFGYTGGAALRLSAEGDFTATSRTWTPAPGGGSYGVTIPSVGGGGASPSVLIVPGDAAFRVNVAFVNPRNVAARVTLQVKDAVRGTKLLELTEEVLPLGFLQLNDLLGGRLPESSDAPLLIEVTSKAPSDVCGCAPVDCCLFESAVLAFATVIDRVTGDASFLLADADAAAPAEASSYLMAFLGCDGPSGPGQACGDPRSHKTYLARSPDGATWSLLPGWQPYQGSVPDVVRRGSTLYIYTPGQVARYHLDTGRLEGPFPVVLQGASQGETFVDPSPLLDENGRIVLVFLHGRAGSDPAGCPPGQATCTQRFGSATEVERSDGVSFALDSGDRIKLPIGQGQAYVGASDPDVFFDGSRWVIYVSHGPNTSVWTSPSLRGTYTRLSDLVTDGSGGIPAGHFDAATRRYWTYSHVVKQGVQVIRRAVHADLTTPLTERDWTAVVTGPLLGMPATMNVASPGFAVDVP